MEKFVILFLIANLLIRFIFKLINIRIVLGIGFQKKILMAFNLIFSLTFIFLEKSQFSMQLIKLGAFFDIFFLFFCHTFFCLIFGLACVLFNSVKIQKNQYTKEVMLEDFFSFLFSFTLFYTFQYILIDYDLVVLLVAVAYGVSNLFISLWIYKKISLYQLFFTALSIFYSLFVFTATNNFVLSVLFYLLQSIPRYISYKKGAFVQ